MKGYLWTGEHPSVGDDVHVPRALGRWEEIAIDAVGNVIEFWGFKRNQGRVWALLYLRGEPLSAGEIEKLLELSKGGVSMLLRDLERWGVILRVRTAGGSSSWRYAAETDLVRMVTRVIEEREVSFLGRIRADLAEARKLAEADGAVSRERLTRLAKMSALAEQTERALRVFLKSAKLDVSGIFGVFRDRRE